MREKETHPTQARCASWVQRYADGCTGRKWNRAKNTGMKKREPHQSEIRVLHGVQPLAVLNKNEPPTKKRGQKPRFCAGFQDFFLRKKLTGQK